MSPKNVTHGKIPLFSTKAFESPNFAQPSRNDGRFDPEKADFCNHAMLGAAAPSPLARRRIAVFSIHTALEWGSLWPLASLPSILTSYEMQWVLNKCSWKTNPVCRVWQVSTRSSVCKPRSPWCVRVQCLQFLCFKRR